MATQQGSDPACLAAPPRTRIFTTVCNKRYTNAAKPLALQSSRGFVALQALQETLPKQIDD
jgi:hypothetical protein